jgi:hypothetical protein
VDAVPWPRIVTGQLGRPRGEHAAVVEEDEDAVARVALGVDGERLAAEPGELDRGVALAAIRHQTTSPIPRQHGTPSTSPRTFELLGVTEAMTVGADDVAGRELNLELLERGP